MNTRFTGNVMTLEHFHDFYYLEALSAAITMEYSNNPNAQFKHSLNRLETDVREAFAHLTHEMAFRIYVYLWAASLGEARYARGHNLPYWIDDINGLDRSSVYHLALDYFPCDENIKTLKNVFNQSWGGAYGGKAWLNIVEAMEMYGKVSDATFIDHSVDLEHNGGCVFSKSAKFGLDCFAYDASDLKSFLDFKFSGNLLESPAPDRRHTTSFTRISHKVYRLIERYMNICTEMGTGKYIRTLIALQLLKPELAWLDGYSVEWDTKVLQGKGKAPLTKEQKAAKKAADKAAGKISTDTHVRKIRVGHTYYVLYDGRSHHCGWDAHGMNQYNRRNIRISHLNSSGFGYHNGWWFAPQWLYEVNSGKAQNKSKVPSNYKVSQEHVRHIEIGKRYFIQYKGNDVSPKWLHDMDKTDNTIIKFDKVMDASGYGYYNTYLYSPVWVYEITKIDILNERYVTVKQDAKQFHGSILWIAGMEILKGKKCKIIGSSNDYPLVQYGDKSYYMSVEWLEPYTETAQDERRERRERRVHDRCYDCGCVIDEDTSIFSTTAMETYCETCYCEKFGTCDKCGSEDWADNFVSTDNHPSYFQLCECCADEVGFVCEDCSEWYPNTEAHSTEDYTYCPDCAEAYTCRECGELHEDLDAHMQDEHAERNA